VTHDAIFSERRPKLVRHCDDETVAAISIFRSKRQDGVGDSTLFAGRRRKFGLFRRTFGQSFGIGVEQQVTFSQTAHLFI
jgi:hypothetical protein